MDVSQRIVPGDLTDADGRRVLLQLSISSEHCVSVWVSLHMHDIGMRVTETRIHGSSTKVLRRARDEGAL